MNLNFISKFTWGHLEALCWELGLETAGILMIPQDSGASLGSSSRENVRNKERFPKMQERGMFPVDDYTTV